LGGSRWGRNAWRHRSLAWLLVCKVLRRLVRHPDFGTELGDNQYAIPSITFSLSRRFQLCISALCEAPLTFGSRL
jgi:hypothetical protein